MTIPDVARYEWWKPQPAWATVSREQAFVRWRYWHTGLEGWPRGTLLAPMSPSMVDERARSPVAGMAAFKRTTVARCDGGHFTAVPAVDCVCGIRGMRSLDDLVAYLSCGVPGAIPAVVGRVALYGRIHEAVENRDPEGTLRAEFADVVGPLYVSPALADSAAEALTDRYGVEAISGRCICPPGAPDRVACVAAWLGRLAGVQGVEFRLSVLASLIELTARTDRTPAEDARLRAQARLLPGLVAHKLRALLGIDADARPAPRVIPEPVRAELLAAVDRLTAVRGR